MQAWANQLRGKHPGMLHHQWYKLDWFRKVLESEHNNQESVDAFVRKASGKRFGAVRMLVEYHRMLRNCLAHSEVGLDNSDSKGGAAVEGGLLNSALLRSASESDVEVMNLLQSTKDDAALVKSWPFAVGGGVGEALLDVLQPLGVQLSDKYLSSRHAVRSSRRRGSTGSDVGDESSSSSGGAPSSGYGASSRGGPSSISGKDGGGGSGIISGNPSNNSSNASSSSGSVQKGSKHDPIRSKPKQANALRDMERGGPFSAIPLKYGYFRRTLHND